MVSVSRYGGAMAVSALGLRLRGHPAMSHCRGSQ